MVKKHITIRIPSTLHEVIVNCVTEKNMTITSWMTSAILEKLIRDGDVEVMQYSPLEDEHYFRG